MKTIHIRSLILTLLFAWTFSSVSSAQPANSMLWKVEGKGIQTSYIFGTIHLLPQSDFQLKKKVENAFMESDLLVLELDMDDPALQGQMMQQAMMKDGQTLDALLSPEDYALLDAELQSTMGVGVAPFNTFKPFFIGAFLLIKYVGETPASFETALMEMAQSQEMPIEGLETVAEQMAFFDAVPYDEQVEDIVEMLRDSERMQSMFRSLVDVYKSENLVEMMSLMESYLDDPEERSLLLDQRNTKWIPVIEAKAKEKATFFGVGAGHLGGPQGVIALLKQAGYTVTPVL